MHRPTNQNVEKTPGRTHGSPLNHHLAIVKIRVAQKGSFQNPAPHLAIIKHKAISILHHKALNPIRDFKKIIIGDNSYVLHVY